MKRQERGLQKCVRPFQETSRFAIAGGVRFNFGVFWKFARRLAPRPPTPSEPLLIGSRTVPLLLVRHPRARRYLLRLRPDGTARVTIPRGGNLSEARAFVERSRGWLEEQFQRLQSQPRLPAAWHPGTEILFRGERVCLEAGDAGQIRFGSENLAVADLAADLRPAIEEHLRGLAARELPPRVLDFAARHQLTVRRVTVRNQKSRWGSCSRRGAISLNWRLVQMPESVRDYIILHELAHLKQMNHSARFWQEVERLCLDYRAAEDWLKTHRRQLR